MKIKLSSPLTWSKKRNSLKNALHTTNFEVYSLEHVFYTVTKFDLRSIRDIPQSTIPMRLINCNVRKMQTGITFVYCGRGQNVSVYWLRKMESDDAMFPGLSEQSGEFPPRKAGGYFRTTDRVCVV